MEFDCTDGVEFNKATETPEYLRPFRVPYTENRLRGILLT